MNKLLLLLIIPFLSFGQNVPIIYAEGGISLKDWSEESGFISSNCYQGVTLFEASSSLKPQGSNSYYIKNLNDYNHKTAWIEGKSDYGVGEYFVVESSNLNIIYNGYQKSKNSWKNNSRVKRFKIYKNGEPLCYLKLSDKMGAQHFTLPLKNLSQQLFDFKFEIVDVYKGDRWNDVAITHIDYKNCEIIEPSNQKSNKINFTPCKCADISYKIAANGGIDNASSQDRSNLDICNKLSENEIFLRQALECPSSKKMRNLWKF